MRITTTISILAASLSLLACGPRDKDKLGDNELAANAASDQVAAADQRCEAQAVQDEIRRLLFARAAETRGSNGDNYAKIAGFALLQLDGATPVVAVGTEQAVDCRARATLRLPSGLRVAGGRTTLGGDIDYSVSAGSRTIVALGQSDAITVPLATLTQDRTAAPAAQPSPAPIPRPEPAPATVPVRNEPTSPPAPSSSQSNPSFDCRRARTSSERAVCESDNLAALDRRMSAQYRAALSDADPAQRRLLAQTRDRFLTYRDRCDDDGCIAQTYRGRIREIDDIVAGRWRGQGQ